VTSTKAVIAKALGAPEPLRRRIIRALLYGRNVDRGAKARARVGLAVAAFAAVYAIIALRLVMFAVAPESHIVRRAGSQDAIAATGKSSPPTCACRRCSASRAASSTWTRRPSC
jgi:hypothetical protein